MAVFLSTGARIRFSNCNIGSNIGVSGDLTINGSGSIWTNTWYIYVGKSGRGTLNITGGGVVNNNYSYIGSETGSTGIVNVDGIGSKWTNTSFIYVGDRGNGALNIKNGGEVTADYATYVAGNAGSTGTINFGTGGGMVTTKCLWASPSQLTGSGIINTKGLVTDTDLLFDSTHGQNQTLRLNDVTVNLTQDTYSDLGVGYYGNGSLTIRDGKNNFQPKWLFRIQ